MYQLTSSPDVVRRLADNVWIPADLANSDYQEYLTWVAEGNQPLPAES